MNEVRKTKAGKNKHYYSVFEDDEYGVLKAILELHCGGAETFDADLTYSRGYFYKQLPRPAYCADINPQFDFVEKRDATKVFIYEENRFNSIIIDPPFMFGNRAKQKEFQPSIAYGIVESKNKLLEMYEGMLINAYHQLRKGGKLIFKCQDFTDSKTDFIHCNVWDIVNGLNMDGRFDLYIKDLVILNIERGKVWNPNLKQRHFRKTHCYFWVMEKKKGK